MAIDESPLINLRSSVTRNRCGCVEGRWGRVACGDIFYCSNGGTPRLYFNECTTVSHSFRVDGISPYIIFRIILQSGQYSFKIISGRGRGDKVIIQGRFGIACTPAEPFFGDGKSTVVCDGCFYDCIIIVYLYFLKIAECRLKSLLRLHRNTGAIEHTVAGTCVSTNIISCPFFKSCYCEVYGVSF